MYLLLHSRVNSRIPPSHAFPCFSCIPLFLLYSTPWQTIFGLIKCETHTTAKSRETGHRFLLNWPEKEFLKILNFHNDGKKETSRYYLTLTKIILTFTFGTFALRWMRARCNFLRFERRNIGTSFLTASARCLIKPNCDVKQSLRSSPQKEHINKSGGSCEKEKDRVTGTKMRFLLCIVITVSGPFAYT